MLRRSSRHARSGVPASMGVARLANQFFSIGRDWSCSIPCTESRRAEQPVADGPALEGEPARLHREGRHRAARLGAHRVHPGAPRRRAALAVAAHRALRPRPGRRHGQPGNPDGRGGSEGHLPERLAGRGRRQPRRADVSRSEPLPLQQCAGPGAIDQQRLPPGRPDPARRGARRRSTTSPRSSPTPRPVSAARSMRSRS